MLLLISVFAGALFFYPECCPSSVINHPCPSCSCSFILQISASLVVPQHTQNGSGHCQYVLTPPVLLFHGYILMSRSPVCFTVMVVHGLQPSPFYWLVHTQSLEWGSGNICHMNAGMTVLWFSYQITRVDTLSGSPWCHLLQCSPFHKPCCHAADAPMHRANACFCVPLFPQHGALGRRARLGLSLVLCLGQGGHGAGEPGELIGAQACLREVHEASWAQMGWGEGSCGHCTCWVLVKSPKINSSISNSSDSSEFSKYQFPN